jgi:uncharacterized pyridoxamine 5'-phosphate oxidase family protein
MIANQFYEEYFYMIPSPSESTKCHWCTQERKEVYAHIIQLFQKVAVCSEKCLGKYSKHAKTQILEVKIVKTGKFKQYEVFYMGR